MNTHDHSPHDHDHDGGHDHHGHHHGLPPGGVDRAFAIGVVLNLGFVVAEAIAGVMAQSLALLADAGHNFGDVLALLLAWGAVWLGKRRPTKRRTYGYKRSSILAALANAVLLTIAVGAMSWEAIRRFTAPETPETGLVMWVAAAGILVNAGTAWLFAAGRGGDLNRRSAFLHMAADAGVSLGVIVAAGAIALTGWLWLDSATTLAIAVIITVGTWRLLRESLDLALDAVPAGIDRAGVEAYLAGLPGVTEVHDLHIWGMSTTETALTVHLVRPDAMPDDTLIGRVCHDLADRFAICHSTIQVEAGNGAHPCHLASAEVV